MTPLLKTIPVGMLAANCFLLADAATRETFVIDPGADAAAIIDVIRREKLVPKAVINTHGHWDHIGANREIKKVFSVPLLIHRADADFLTTATLNCADALGGGLPSPMADQLLEDGQTLALGGLTLTVIHTPGHTPGGISLLADGLLFTGDTLFCGTIGRCDLPGGSERTLMASLKAYERLPGTLAVLPGHGPSCVLDRERAHNPYL